MNQVLMTGVEIAKDIKRRCRALKERGIKLTVKRAFSEAGVSYLTYKSWMGGRTEPRMRTVQKVDAVIARYETAEAVG